MSRRDRNKPYFERVSGAPEPVAYEIRRRLTFSEADVMGISWYGRYPQFFEEASTELGRRCGLSFEDYFQSGLRAPIAELHVDYFCPLMLDEEFNVRASIIWNEAARINTEYRVTKIDGTVATSGYRVQVLTEASTGKVCLISPELLVRFRRRWMDGEFKGLR